MRTVIFALSLVAIWSPLLVAQELPRSVLDADRSQVAVIKDVVYGTGGDQRLKLDLAMPKRADAPAACIVVIHGGAWREGDKSALVAQIKRFADIGYVSASVNYRHCPNYVFPAQVEDVKCAVRFLRGNAKTLGIDVTRFGAIGHSAGGHLAMMLDVVDESSQLEGAGGHAQQSSKVQAAVSFSGPTALDAKDIPEASKPLVRDFLGGTVHDKPALAKTASPISHLSKDDGPILMIHATYDEIVPPTQVYRMIDAMGRIGVKGRAEIVPGLGHDLSPTEAARGMREAEIFFAQTLRAAAPR